MTCVKVPSIISGIQMNKLRAQGGGLPGWPCRNGACTPVPPHIMVVHATALWVTTGRPGAGHRLPLAVL